MTPRYAVLRNVRVGSLLGESIEKRSAGSTWLRRGLIVLALGGTGYGACWALKRPYSEGGLQGAVAEQKHEEHLDALRASLAKEPCDRNKIVELGEGLLRLGEPREALDRSSAFFAKCGEYPRLLWVTYAAHERLGEWDAAIADATKLIDGEPENKDYWWWRGVIYENHGDPNKAIEDFRAAIAIEPALTSIPINLADTYEKVGRHCDAIQPLEQLVHHHPENTARIKTRIERLYQRAECKPLLGQGNATIKFKPNAPIIETAAKVNDQPGKLIVDTGASYVSIGPRLAKAAKIDSTSWPSVTLETAKGPRRAKLGIVDSIVVAGVRAEHVEVALLDDELTRVDGLLGLSFLSRFNMSLDPGKGELSLKPRD